MGEPARQPRLLVGMDSQVNWRERHLRGWLLAFPEDAPGVFLKPNAEHTFTPVMSEQASVSFEGSTELMTSLTFEQNGKAMRFVRAR